jgi:hypothetical protein
MMIDWQMEADRANRLYADASRRIEQLEAELARWTRQAEDNSGGWQRACLRIEQLEAVLRGIANKTKMDAVAAVSMRAIAREALVRARQENDESSSLVESAPPSFDGTTYGDAELVDYGSSSARQENDDVFPGFRGNNDHS